MGDANRPTDLAGSWNRAIDAANAEIDTAIAAADRAERCLDAHGYGCARAECGRSPVAAGDIRGIAEYIGPSREGKP
jgi:hypothetical protein